MTSTRRLLALSIVTVGVLVGCVAAAPTPLGPERPDRAGAAAVQSPEASEVALAPRTTRDPRTSEPTRSPRSTSERGTSTDSRRDPTIAAIVDRADPDLMEVLVTRRDTAGRPKFETVKVADKNHARDVVGGLLGTPGVIGVEMNQRITVAQEPGCPETDSNRIECAPPPADTNASPEPGPAPPATATPTPATDPGDESNAAPRPPPAPSDEFLDRQWALDGQHLDIHELNKITAADSQLATVAVIDTGVQADHPDLSGRIGDQVDFITATGNVDDECGHGTHVAGTIAAIQGNDLGIAGMTRAVTVHSVKVLGSNPDKQTGACDGTFASVAEGIRWAADHADVLNLSLAANSSSDTLALSVAMENAVAYAIGEGRVVIAAAGNSQPQCTSNDVPCETYPAAYPGVVGVGAIDVYGNVANFSNRGPWVDLVAPGVGILSTCKNSAYCVKHGTSMAAPHVSAVAAMALAHCGLSGPEVSRRLIERASHHAAGHSEASGFGSVRPQAVLNCD